MSESGNLATSSFYSKRWESLEQQHRNRAGELRSQAAQCDVHLEAQMWEIRRLQQLPSFQQKAVEEKVEEQRHTRCPDHKGPAHLAVGSTDSCSTEIETLRQENKELAQLCLYLDQQRQWMLEQLLNTLASMRKDSSVEPPTACACHPLNPTTGCKSGEWAVVADGMNGNTSKEAGDPSDHPNNGHSILVNELEFTAGAATSQPLTVRDLGTIAEVEEEKFVENVVVGKEEEHLQPLTITNRSNRHQEDIRRLGEGFVRSEATKPNDEPLLPPSSGILEAIATLPRIRRVKHPLGATTTTTMLPRILDVGPSIFNTTQGTTSAMTPLLPPLNQQVDEVRVSGENRMSSCSASSTLSSCTTASSSSSSSGFYSSPSTSHSSCMAEEGGEAACDLPPKMQPLELSRLYKPLSPLLLGKHNGHNETVHHAMRGGLSQPLPRRRSMLLPSSSLSKIEGESLLMRRVDSSSYSPNMFPTMRVILPTPTEPLRRKATPRTQGFYFFDPSHASADQSSISTLPPYQGIRQMAVEKGNWSREYSLREIDPQEQPKWPYGRSAIIL